MTDIDSGARKEYIMENGLTYTKVGDYYIPDLTLGDQPGGQRRRSAPGQIPFQCAGCGKLERWARLQSTAGNLHDFHY